MGCHTWLNRKVKDPDYEYIKKVVIKNLQDNINYSRGLYDRLDKGILTDEDKEMIEYYPEWNSNRIFYENNICLYERQIQIIKKNLCKVATCRKYAHVKNLKYIEGKGFYQSLKYCNIFRKHGYPHDKLFSYEDTIAYMNNPENKCEIYDKSYEWAKEFWDKNPDGMIYFG